MDNERENFEVIEDEIIDDLLVEDEIPGEEIPEYKPKEDRQIESEKKGEKKKKREKTKKNGKRKFGVFILAAAAIVAVIIGIIVVFNSLGKITIAGETIEKDEKTVRLYGKIISKEDCEKIASLGKMETLHISECIFEDDAIDALENVQGYLTHIEFINCENIKSCKFVSSLKYVTVIRFLNCGLSDADLNEMDFSNKEYLREINLSGNKDISDLSIIAKCGNLLQYVFVNETSVTDFSSLSDKEGLFYIECDHTGFSDLNTIKNPNVRHLSISDNEITDISKLADFKYLDELYANNNKITDISPLSNNEYIKNLELGDNNISTLLPLTKTKTIENLNVENNKLENLNGLESDIYLKNIDVSGNSINDISGLINTTLLEYIDFDDNQISDLSYLTKSVSTIKELFFNNNQVEDITPISGASNLSVFEFDNNKIKNLDAIESSSKLQSISGEYNELTSIDGLKNAKKIKHIYLAHNKIENIDILCELERGDLGGVELEQDSILNSAIIDLSNNNISVLNGFSTNRNYVYLALYNNPITSYEALSAIKGTYLLITYIDGMDTGFISDNFDFYKITDCPLDKQVEVTKDLVSNLKYKIQFCTVEEANEQTREMRKEHLNRESKVDSTKKETNDAAK